MEKAKHLTKNPTIGGEAYFRIWKKWKPSVQQSAIMKARRSPEQT